MKSNLSILSALMFIVKLFSEFFKELKKRNVTEKMIFDALQSNDEFIPEAAKEIADLVLCGAKNVIHVAAELSLRDRIALGKYDVVNESITEKSFSEKIIDDYTIKFKLCHFDRPISSDKVIKEMKKDGFSPGTFPELLALVEANPELQKQFHIVALGSVRRRPGGRRFVLIVGSSKEKRSLDLHRFGGDWSSDDRFLAVRR